MLGVAGTEVAEEVRDSIGACPVPVEFDLAEAVVPSVAGTARGLGRDCAAVAVTRGVAVATLGEGFAAEALVGVVPGMLVVEVDVAAVVVSMDAVGALWVVGPVLGVVLVG